MEFPYEPLPIEAWPPEARAALEYIARLRAKAAAGDEVAALVVRKLDAVEQVLIDSLFSGGSDPLGLASLVGDHGGPGPGGRSGSDDDRR